MATQKQTYRYIKANSILYNEHDRFSLTVEEYNILYKFFVTYSLGKNQSDKQRTFADYGWNYFARKINDKEPKPNIYLKDALAQIIDLDDTTRFIFTDEDNLEECFIKLDLTDGPVNDLCKERAVIGKTSESNRYLKLFYRIRDGFAHGKFILKYNASNEAVIIIQDNSPQNVTARIVIKLQTLFDLIRVIDKNSLIIKQTKTSVA